MKIEVIGTGCPTCKQLFEITKRAVSEINQDADVVYVSGQDGMKYLMKLGLMQSPALAINGKVVMVGYSSNIQQIKSLITENG